MSNTKIKFNCGCEFTKNEQGKIVIPIETFWDNLNYKCSAAWDLINSGDVKCGFQIESSFGQQLVKRLKFKTIDDIGHLSALMRPSCTDSKMEDGKSLTDHYIMRVNGEEEPTPFHPAIEPYLRDTQQILTYQEQAAQIVQAIAGFTASEADDLRKACAKKRADLMAPLKIKFLEGCKKIGSVGEHDAERVWQWLESGQRYGFNRSVTDDTIVTTKEGMKLLKDVNIGDKILAPKNNEENEYIEVINKYDHGTQEIYEIETDNGKNIKCTLDHKFLCENGEILPLFEILQKNYKIMVY